MELSRQDSRPIIEYPVKIKGQIGSLLTPDLNCGRYCAEAIIKYYFPDVDDGMIQQKLGIAERTLSQFITYHFPDPENTPWYVKAGEFIASKELLNNPCNWSVDREGAKYFYSCPINAEFDKWYNMLKNSGPFIVGGELADAIFIYVEHAVVVTGAIPSTRKIIVQDPFSTKAGGAKIVWDWELFKEKVFGNATHTDVYFLDKIGFKNS